MHSLREWPVPFLVAWVNSPHLCSVWPQDCGYVRSRLFYEAGLSAATLSGLVPMPKGVRTTSQSE